MTMKRTDHLEIEVKLYIPDLSAVVARLEAAGAEQVSPRVFEHNVRYENAEKSLSARGIVVRLRKDTRVRLTYKEPPAQHDGDLWARFEAEVEVSDFSEMELILGRLGYYPHLTYEKYRTTYMLNGAEIVLDELPYGNFVEVEGEAETIQRVLSQLNLENKHRYKASYVVLFDHVREHLKLDFTDLTFENFRGIDVPGSVFEAFERGYL